VIDTASWGENQQIAPAPPAITELSVLRRRRREAGIEAADTVKQVGRYTDVVRSEKHPVIIGVEVGVQVVDQHLAGHRAGIIGEGVDGMTADRETRGERP